MRLGKQLSALATIAAAMMALAARAFADVGADFANQLHGYGIYAPRDYNALLAKITCERLGNGLDDNPTSPPSFFPTTRRAAPAPRRPGSSSPPQSPLTAPTRRQC